MRTKIIDNANKMVPIMNRLLREGYDIWENTPHYEGYGFKVLLEDKWIEIRLDYHDEEPSRYDIHCFKKNEEHRNILDSFMCKELAKKEITDTNEMYQVIKGMIE